MPYDVGVSQYLQGKGVSSGDIGYDQNSGNVTIRGQNFYKPELNMAGTTYSNQNNLDNAYGNYSKSLPVIQPDGSVGTVGQNTGMEKAAATSAGVTPGAGQGGGKPASTGYSNPYTQMIGDLIKHLSDTSNAPQQDIYSSPQYAAAKASQDRQSADTIRHANESAAGAGLGHSTIMTDRSQRIQDDSNNYLQTQLVPQIMSQLQAAKQQEIQNQHATLNDYMNLANHADAEHQNEITNANSDRTFKAGRDDAATTATGIWNPSGKSVQEVQAKMDANSKAYATATPEEQQKLHDENIQLAGLLGKTFDPNTGKYSEGQGFVGTKTVAQKQLDLNNVKDMALLTGRMPDGTLTNAAQQQALTNEWTASEKLGVITPALAHLYGLPPGTKTEAAKEHAANLAVSQQHADAATKGANTAADKLAWEKDPKNPANILKESQSDKVDMQTELLQHPNSPKATTYMNATIAQLNKTYGEIDPMTGKNKGISAANKPALRKSIIDMNLPDSATDQLLGAFGLPTN